MWPTLYEEQSADWGLDCPWDLLGKECFTLRFKGLEEFLEHDAVLQLGLPSLKVLLAFGCS